MSEGSVLPEPWRAGRLSIAPERVGAVALREQPSGRERPIEIVAPDDASSELLLEYAAPIFAAELVAGCIGIVRLRLPAGRPWALQMLSLVSRWLAEARLPSAEVLYDGRSYLISASTDLAQFVTELQPAAEELR